MFILQYIICSLLDTVESNARIGAENDNNIKLKMKIGCVYLKLLLF